MQVQEKLNVQADGKMGPQTQKALKEFQQSKGIKATGQLDQQTLSELGVSGSAAGGGSASAGSSSSGKSSEGSSAASGGSSSGSGSSAGSSGSSPSAGESKKQ